jgi:hypothetical protein
VPVEVVGEGETAGVSRHTSQVSQGLVATLQKARNIHVVVYILQYLAQMQQPTVVGRKKVKERNVEEIPIGRRVLLVLLTVERPL